MFDETNIVRPNRVSSTRNPIEGEGLEARESGGAAGVAGSARGCRRGRRGAVPDRAEPNILRTELVIRPDIAGRLPSVIPSEPAGLTKDLLDRAA